MQRLLRTLAVPAVASVTSLPQESKHCELPKGDYRGRYRP
jgi:hypothetical protein